MASSLMYRQREGESLEFRDRAGGSAGRVPVDLVELELPVAVDDSLAAAPQLSRNHAIARGDDIRVHARVVEAKLLPALGGHLTGIAVVSILVGAPERDVGVAELTTGVLVVERLGHEAGDPREAPVGE